MTKKLLASALAAGAVGCGGAAAIASSSGPSIPPGAVVAPMRAICKLRPGVTVPPRASLAGVKTLCAKHGTAP